MLKVVLDTNVLVSALLKDDSLPAYILALVLRKMMALCLSEDIFEEYQAVLHRDRFHKIKNEAVPLLSSLKKAAIRVEPKNRITEITNDPADNKFLECAVEADADFIITGNTRHFPFKSYRNIRIVSPKAFIDDALKLVIKLP